MIMYVLVLNSLSKSQQAVQAGHALADYLLTFDCCDIWNNDALIYLRATAEQLKQMNVGIGAEWREPDLDNMLTAVAMLGKENDPRFIDFRLV